MYVLFLVYNYSDERVVVDGNLVTSRSPGTTFLFALTLVSKLVGDEVKRNRKRKVILGSNLALFSARIDVFQTVSGNAHVCQSVVSLYMC